jgi:hypothetical protein
MLGSLAVLYILREGVVNSGINSLPKAARHLATTCD